MTLRDNIIRLIDDLECDTIEYWATIEDADDGDQDYADDDGE